MSIRTTTIKGLVIDLVIEEFNDRDTAGHLNAYIATIYRQDKKASSRTIICRSRLPGAASELERAIKRNGLQAFRRLAQVRNTHHH